VRPRFNIRLKDTATCSGDGAGCSNEPLPPMTFEKNTLGLRKITIDVEALWPASARRSCAAQYENVRFRFQTISPVAAWVPEASCHPAGGTPVHSHRNEALPVFSPYPRISTDTAQLTVRGSQGSVVR
jgi:hypothetical protein